MEFQARASLAQCDFSGGFGVAHPLGSSARSHQETLAVQLQQIDGSGEQLAGLASADFEQVVVSEPQTEPDQETERAVEYFLYRGGFAKYWRAGRHAVIVTPRGQLAWGDGDE